MDELERAWLVRIWGTVGGVVSALRSAMASALQPEALSNRSTARTR